MCLNMDHQMPLFCYVRFVNYEMLGHSLPIDQPHVANII